MGGAFFTGVGFRRQLRARSMNTTPDSPHRLSRATRRGRDAIRDSRREPFHRSGYMSHGDALLSREARRVPEDLSSVLSPCPLRTGSVPAPYFVRTRSVPAPYFVRTGDRRPPWRRYRADTLTTHWSRTALVLSSREVRTGAGPEGLQKGVGPDLEPIRISAESLGICSRGR